MPAFRVPRGRRRRTYGLKPCATCGAGVGSLQQRQRWAAGFRLTVCPECDRLDNHELGAKLQQRLNIGTPPNENPEEVG